MTNQPLETLADLLLACGIGPYQAARAASISPHTVYDWVAGRRAPQNQRIAQLAAALGVSPDRVLAACKASVAAAAK
jgi:hypothetical protein